MRIRANEKLISPIRIDRVFSCPCLCKDCSNSFIVDEVFNCKLTIYRLIDRCFELTNRLIEDVNNIIINLRYDAKSK